MASLTDNNAGYGIRNKEGRPVNKGDCFFSGDSLGIVESTQVIAAILIQLAGEPPTDTMRISVAEVKDHKIGAEKNSMLVNGLWKLAMSIPIQCSSGNSIQNDLNVKIAQPKFLG